MKEKLIGFITLVVIVLIVLINLLQSNGMEDLDRYREQQKNIITQTDDMSEQYNPEWTIEIDAYSNYEQALNLAKQLEKIRLKVLISERKVGGIVLFRVRVFQKNERDNIKNTIKKLERNEYSFKVLKPSQQ